VATAGWRAAASGLTAHDRDSVYNIHIYMHKHTNTHTYDTCGCKKVAAAATAESVTARDWGSTRGALAEILKSQLLEDFL